MFTKQQKRKIVTSGFLRKILGGAAVIKHFDGRFNKLLEGLWLTLEISQSGFFSLNSLILYTVYRQIVKFKVIDLKLRCRFTIIFVF